MLPKPWRKLLVALHVTLACLWLGGAAAALVLIVFGAGAADLEAWWGARSAFWVREVLLYPASVGFLLTGLAFCLATPWGFATFRWVAVKWLAYVALAVWSNLAVGAWFNEVAALVDLGSGAAPDIEQVTAVRKLAIGGTAIELAALMALVWVSVEKPWGKVQRLRLDIGRKKLVGGTLALTGLAVAITVGQTWMLASIRARVVPAIDVSAVPDGAWAGTVEDAGIRFDVVVHARAGRIERVDVEPSFDNGWSRLGARVGEKIVAAQRVDVDALTGATTSSRLTQLAVANALERAGR